MRRKAVEIANYIVKTAAENTESGNYIFHPEELCAELNLSEKEYFEVIGYVTEELVTRKELLDLVNVGDGTIDVNIALEYCPNYVWCKGDEEIFGSYEEFEKREILPVAQPACKEMEI